MTSWPPMAGNTHPLSAPRHTGLLDTGAVHASCCALAEATRGHDTVADLIHEAATVCAPTAVMEVPRLIPGTGLRPASLLTTAQGNTRTAFDVSVCSEDQEADKEHRHFQMIFSSGR